MEGGPRLGQTEKLGSSHRMKLAMAVKPSIYLLAADLLGIFGVPKFLSAVYIQLSIFSCLYSAPSKTIVKYSSGRYAGRPQSCSISRAC
jgi:hypothetical protein